MNSTTLEDTRENYIFNLHNALASINLDKKFPGAFFMAALSYRILGICALLLEADTKSFIEMFRKSGQARLSLLRLVNGGLKPDGKYICLSKDIAFTSALAAGDINLAKEIASLSPQNHFENIEYEDNYLFIHFLQSIVSDPENRQYLQAVLKRWEIVLGGNSSGYYDACNSILTGDRDEFDKGFGALIAERSAELNRYTQNFSYDKEMYSAEGKVFVEGLAVLRIAELNGINTKAEYTLVPGIARAPVALSLLPPDSWRIQ